MVFTRKALTTVITTIPILCFFTTNIMTAGRIQGESMAPTLHNKDFVLLIKNPFRELFFLRKLEPGDVVFFKSPQDNTICCKRIKFEQHQTVDMIQEKAVDEIHVVPKNHFFMVGDNLNNSIDSRKYGYVPNGLIVGYVNKSAGVIWPPNRWFSKV
jgi:mitochondrial inner membrane protease subunit 1